MSKPNDAVRESAQPSQSDKGSDLSVSLWHPCAMKAPLVVPQAIAQTILPSAITIAMLVKQTKKFYQPSIFSIANRLYQKFSLAK